MLVILIILFFFYFFVSGDAKDSYGHMRLRTLIGELYGDKDEAVYIAQFSSIGSLGSTPYSWIGNQLLRSLAGGKNACKNLRY